MRRFYLIIVLLVFFINCDNHDNQKSNQNEIRQITSDRQTDWEKLGLKENVKQLVRQSFGIKGDDDHLTRVLLKKELYRFNQSGMKTEVQGFNEFNKQISQSHYKYNKAGIIEEETFYDSKGILLTKIHYHYNDKGNKVKEVKTDIIGNLTYISEWIYEERKKVVAFTNSIRKNSTTSILTKEETTYHQNGNIQKVIRTEYKSNGNIHFVRINMYDENGKIIRRTESNDQNEIIDRVEYTYNKDDSLIKLVDYFYNYETEKYTQKESTYEYNSDGKLIKSIEPGQTITYTYDTNGNELTKIQYTESGILWRKTDKSYNDGMNIIEEKVITYKEDNSVDTTIVYTYFYDEKNNHIKTECHRLNNPEKPVLAMVYEYILTYWE